MSAHPATFALVAVDFAHSAQAAGQSASALESLHGLAQREPGIDLLNALAVLDPDASPTPPSSARAGAASPEPVGGAGAAADGPEGDASDPDRALVDQALAHAARPLQRFRCAACGFEAQHYFWQCPGCLGWDSYPPTRLEDL